MKLIIAPSVEPVTLVEAKEHARYVDSDQDPMFRRLIRAATSDAENYTRRALIEQTWEIAMRCWPDEIRLPLPPLMSVVSVKYDDASGVEQTLPTTQYQVDGYVEPARIVRAHGVTWPNVRGSENSIRIRFKAGYGSTGGSVPEPIRAWILIRVAQLFEHREQVVTGTIIQPVPFVDGLLDPYRFVAI